MEKARKIICLAALFLSFLVVSCSNASGGGSEALDTTTTTTTPTTPTTPTSPTVSKNPFVGTWLAGTGNKLVFYSNMTVYANWMGYGKYSYKGSSATIVFGSSSGQISISGTSFIFHGVRFVKQL